MNTIESIRSLLIKGKMQEINALVKEALEQGIDAAQILDEGLLAGMDDIARKWAEGTAFIPEVLVGARCMNAAIEILEPYLVHTSAGSRGRIIMGTVAGDLHDIGKNLCILMMKAKSFEVIDLGVDVSAKRFVEAVQEYRPQVLCLSSLLTTTMGNMKTVIEALKEAGLRDLVRVAVGGAPVTQAFADEIGADLYTEDAVQLADALPALIP